MELFVLGCEGSWPSEGGATSGYLLRDGDHHLVLDLGFNTATDLLVQLNGTAPDAVLLTHRHDDHWADLPELARSIQRPVPLLAPAELLAELPPELSAAFSLQVLEEGACSAGVFAVEARRCDHGPETYAVAISGPSGGRLVASADTGPAVAWQGWAAGSTFLCEASYGATREGSLRHLSGREAGLLASEVGASSLWLTHLQPGEDREMVLAEARNGFPGPTLAIQRRARYQVG